MMASLKKIAFVGGQKLPLIAVRGGATQTLVTALLDENEIRKEFEITVLTGYVPELDAASEKYQYTRVVSIRKNVIQDVAILCYRIIRKVLGGRLPRKSVFMYTVNKKLNMEHYDVVVMETSQHEVAQLQLRDPKTKVAFHVHSDYLTEATPDISKAAENCDCVIAVSEYIFGRIERIPAMSGKVVTLKNAIKLNLDDPYSCQKDRKLIRERYGFSDADVVVLYCSRLSPEKGCLELIQAAQRVPQCKVLVVGGEDFSSDVETEYVRLLHSQAKSLNGRVVFTGAVAHNQVFGYMAASDIGVIPSMCNEAAPLTLLEFRNSGLPTVVANRGGIPEYIDKKGTILVDTGEGFVDRLADAIRILAEDPDKRETLAMSAREGIDEYSYSSYYTNFSNLVNSIG